MHENYSEECCANNCDISHKNASKKSDSRNIGLRTRTKSENGILCGDTECSITEMNRNSQFNQCLAAVENEAINHVRIRPQKRHMCSADEESPDLVVTAIYNYQPSQEDELTLYPGDKVRVLSNDYRDSGTEGWWVGLRDSQIGVFPVNYVDTDLSWSHIKDINDKDVPPITPRTPNESFKIPFSQDCLVDVVCDKNAVSCGNGFALSGSTGVRMIASSEINKLECLGSGSFGVVYHGRWNNKEVAVKTFSAYANEVHIYQEAGHLSCLLHPNIVRLFGVSIINDMGNQIALIMEYARGGALHNFLHFGTKIKLSPHTLLQMSKQVASGMKYLHKDAGICHRDLKSSNVLIKDAIPDGATDLQIANCTLLITDFGMARRTAELVSQQSKLGTLAYAAPEVCKQQGGFTVKSDVWSYGVLLWELLTIEIPYRDVEQPHLLYKIAIKNHTLHIPSGIPTLLVNLLISCWNENRDLRPDFEEVSQILNRAQHCKFMEISAEDFHSIQDVWKEEIRLSEKYNDESLPSSDTERDEFLEQQRELAYAKEELQKREEEMQRREAACSQAMGTVNQIKLLFSVLVANQIPRMSGYGDHYVPSSQSPPIPPPRKRPFVGRLKFWGHTSPMSSANQHQHHNCLDSSTTTLGVANIASDESGGNPNISAPSNVQHVVHISQQDFNMASPALKFFPDSMKMHTWGPNTNGKFIFNDNDRSKIPVDHETMHSNNNNCTNQFLGGGGSSLEDSSLQMDCSENAEFPSPCIDTPSSVCAVGADSELNMCSSAPNLRKISLGTLPVLGFSSFRRPFNDKVEESAADPPAISNCPSCYFKWLDHRKKVPCERCRWRPTNRSATLGPSSTLSTDEGSVWSCIPQWPPASSHQRVCPDNLTGGRKKSQANNNNNNPQESLKRAKNGRGHRREKKVPPCRLHDAMWSVMRMLSAVALPDRRDEEDTAHEMLSTLEIPETSNSSTTAPVTIQGECRQSCSPTLSLDITTEEDDLSSGGGGLNDSVFHPTQLIFNKTPPQCQASPESARPPIGPFKTSSLPKPSTLKSLSSRCRTRPPPQHCKARPCVTTGAAQHTPGGRGSSVPATASRRPPHSPNYFASWLPSAHPQN